MLRRGQCSLNNQILSKKSKAKSISYRIRKLFEYNPLSGFSYRQIQKRVGQKYSKNLIAQEVDILISEGVLAKGPQETIYDAKNPVVPPRVVDKDEDEKENKKGKDKGNKKGKDEAKSKGKNKDKQKTVEGIVDLTARGSGFLMVEGMEKDIFIAQRNMNNAFEGDRVRLKMTGVSKRGRVEGKVVEILKRRQDSYVCTISKNKNFAFAVSESRGVPVDFYVKIKNLNGANDGDRVLIEMIGWPKSQKNPFGNVVSVIGKPGENDVEMISILMDKGFKLKFPKKVKKFANDIPMEIPAEEIAKRKDMREITTFTIDPHDAKDFDDALSIRTLENGNYEIGVHIADVSHYVPIDSEADKEARIRATSVYLVDRVVPMLPEKISNMVCSLRPHEEKLCFSAIFEMNEKAEVLSKEFTRTVIYSDRRFTYEEAQQVIETGEGEELVDEILTLDKLAKILRAKRIKEGSIRFDRPEIRFKLDETGKPIEVYQKIQKEANMLIEDFMLLANREVAAYFKNYVLGKEKIAGVYRIHDEPEEEKLENLKRMSAKFGHKGDFSSPQSIAQSINSILAESQGKPEGGLLDVLAIRSMAKAEYSTNNIGHYGLGFEDYTHFTSPIRRYPDVMVHRVLQDLLDKKPKWSKEALDEILKHSSNMEKNAQRAERESVKYKQVEYMTDRLGQEFDGVISGVQSFGFFVELEENYCEGMVRTESLTGDQFEFIDEEFAIVGKNSKKRYQIGGKVRVQVAATDLKTRTIDFELIS